ncbi:MAG: hypothetical protein OHK0022_46380 [Roseiflexaceae bacterium]
MYVTLAAPDLDELGEPRFEGSEASLKHVRTSLGELRSSGILGQLLNELPTPRNLVAVMSSSFMQRYEPVLVAGWSFLVPSERAVSEVITHLSNVVATLFGDTLPKVLAFAGPPRATLIEQIELIIVLGRALVDELSLPANASAQLASQVWQLLAQAGKDASWLQGMMPEVAAVIDPGVFQAPQRGAQVAAVIRHLVEALNAPEQHALPALVALLETDWAVGAA